MLHIYYTPLIYIEYPKKIRKNENPRPGRPRRIREFLFQK